MKLREFLKDVDPEVCDARSFINYSDFSPVCPLGHAAVKHGYNPKTNTDGIRVFLLSKGLEHFACSSFYVTYDTEFMTMAVKQTDGYKKLAFERALAAGEETEQKLEVDLGPAETEVGKETKSETT